MKLIGREMQMSRSDFAYLLLSFSYWFELHIYISVSASSCTNHT